MGVDQLVSSVTTYRRRSPLGFLYGGPFAVLYAIWAYYWVAQLGFDEYYELGCIGVAVIGIGQVLAVLFCYWFVEVNCLFTCDSVPDPTKASLAKVVPQPNNGWTELLPDGSTRTWFDFQKITYVLNEETKQFGSLTYDTSRTLEEFYCHKGFDSDEVLQDTKLKYGNNDMEMSIPQFSELFIERATAPFFVFQDMWYYSLFTLVMLMTFEAMIVKQQLKNMQDIRNMGNKPYQIYAYRNRRWNRVASNELVFGDIVSVTRSSEEKVVPCDLLLLRGQCIVDESMLTGESVPQMKEPIEETDRKRVFDFGNDGRLHVISGGTKVVQHNPPGKTEPGIKSPDNGCVCFVLRTGFNTSQGQLLRTILFGVKRVTANNLETFAFILFLMIFAVAAAAYVWIKGTADPDRNKYKLFLECSLIITSVIPPELPIELSLAVNNSLIALQKLGVFCTEPFRIPFAGKINICCFDKTGTLTTDNLVVEGIAGLVGPDCGENKKDVVPLARNPQEADPKSIQVLASCQSLVRFDEELVGDPMEKACLSWIDWNLSRNDTVIPQKSKMQPLKIVQRYHFSSQMRRMTVVSSYIPPGTTEPKHLAVVKGAPEVLYSMYKQAPADYNEVYQKLAQAGSRVLALGIRELGPLSHADIRAGKREDYEKDLEFAGFVVISCPLKVDTKAMIKEIVDSSHAVTMITGDNPLTACHVGQVLHFTRKTHPVLILDEHEQNGCAQRAWKSVDGTTVITDLAPEGKKEIKEFLNKYEFCLTGHGYEHLVGEMPHFLDVLLPHVRIFARMSPKQKEHVVNRLKHLGFTTLMCGDGTNDVGALKHSHVGVALLAHPYDPEKEKEQQVQKQKKVMEIREAAEHVRRVNPNDLPTRLGGQRKPETTTNPGQKKQTPNNPHLARLEQLMKELEEEEQLQVIKLGDASIAAPFTSKYTSIQSICHVIKQGRCTLVTTLQMFKILALNALISAYSQSVLYLNGVKFSDSQVTVQGLLLASCFFFVCRSNPLKSLSKQRPIPNIFNAYTLLTVTLQFVVHFFFLVQVFDRVDAIEPLPEKVNLEAEFKPNLLNSAIYILSMALQMCTFAVNYRGRPFMESLLENKPLLYSVVVSLCATFVLASNGIPEFSQKFEIVIMPDEFRNFMVLCVAGDLVSCFVIDRVLNFFLGDMRA